LSGKLNQPPLLLLLFFLKLLCTSLTLGSGASGGIFSPGLFMGVTLGGAYGIAVDWIFPTLGISPSAFAVAGMAGVIGGSTGATMASIVMIFEMTRDYTVIVPMTITVALSYGIRKMLSPQSIYTLKLARRGHYMPSNFLSNYHLVLRARDIMVKDIRILPAPTTVDDYVQSLSSKPPTLNAVVEESGTILGIFGEEQAMRSIAEHGGKESIGEISDKNYVKVLPDTKVFDIVEMLRAQKATVALVLNDPEDFSTKNIIGLVDKNRILDTMEESIDFFSE
ncbi:MAG: chloride channel protein, partial [Desulfobacterales bacterium]